MSAIHPCPFCGSDSVKLGVRCRPYIEFSTAKYLQVSWYVRCNKCHARGPLASGRQVTALFSGEMPKWHTDDKELKERAVDAWNSREVIRLETD